MICHWNLEEYSHGSDHIPTSTTWHITLPKIIKKRAGKRANWNEIYNFFLSSNQQPLPWATDQTLQAVQGLENNIIVETNKWVPCAVPNPSHSPWWSTAILELCQRMPQATSIARSWNPPPRKLQEKPPKWPLPGRKQSDKRSRPTGNTTSKQATETQHGEPSTYWDLPRAAGILGTSKARKPSRRNEKRSMPHFSPPMEVYPPHSPPTSYVQH